jgi:hypothetical protein
MPQMRMKIDRVPVDGHRRALGALINVDEKTARALVHLGIAELEPEAQTYKRGDMTAESIHESQDSPAPQKRAYKRRDLKASK